MAQGVDPTTLDPMNHQETPAVNLARNMFDTLLERDENLVIQPALGGTATYDAETVYVPHFRSGKILGNYYNADFDGKVDQAQTVMDAKKRLEAYLRINRLWADDAAGRPLYQQLDLYGATRRMAWKARGDEAIKGFEMAVR